MSNSKPSSDLFNLIKSLNPDDEKYFYKYTSQRHIAHRENFIELFKLIQAQQQYDEKELNTSLSSPTWAKRLTYSKNELQQYIYDSLVTNSSNTTVNSDIYYLLQLADLLKEKSLYKQALKKINRAREIAIQYEKHFSLLEILDAQRKLLKVLPNADHQKELDTIVAEKNKTLEFIKCEDHFSRLNDTVYLLYRQLNVAREEHKLQELETIMQSPSLQHESNAPTFDSKLKFYTIHSEYHQLKADYKKALTYREKLMKLWENNPHQIAEMPQRYREELASLLTIRHFNADYTGFEELIAKIEGIRKGNLEEDAFTFRQVYPLRQLYLLNNNKAEEAYRLIPEIKKGLDTYGELINPSRLHSFWFNIIVTCFLVGKYSEALPWVNLILNPGIDKKVRTDLRDFVSILEIILHYETGKYELVENKLLNTRKRLNYKNKLYKFEDIVLHNLSALINAHNNKAEMRKVVKEFTAQLHQLEQTAGKEKLIGLEEIIIWIKNK
jgi:hypothetical protein